MLWCGIMRSKGIAKVVSYVFSAPLYASYLIIYLILKTKYLMHALSIAFAFLYLSILPVITIVIDSVRGRTDIFVSKVTHRYRYFIHAILAYFAGFLTFMLLGNYFMALFSLTYALNTAVAMALSLRDKVSVHMAAIAGPNTFLTMTLGIEHLALFTILPIVAWARLKLGAHTAKQLVVGALASIITTYVVVTLFTPMVSYT